MNIVSKVVKKYQYFKNKSKLVEFGKERSLFKTYRGDFYWLRNEKDFYVDNCIKEEGVFEKESTALIYRFLKEGDVVLDVGANIGYYSILFARLVGTRGQVHCFEPTEFYGKVLKKNIETNKASNVFIHSFGLSNKSDSLPISIGYSSATIHDPYNGQYTTSVETIRLASLDEVIDKVGIKKIDFIKIDVDGHEPLFIQGAIKTIKKFKPKILLEVNHLNYFTAGFTAWDFYNSLKEMGAYIYNEKLLEEILDLNQFLKQCGNFDRSANILITFEKL